MNDMHHTLWVSANRTDVRIGPNQEFAGNLIVDP
jgi:hypothetical protein